MITFKNHIERCDKHVEDTWDIMSAIINLYVVLLTVRQSHIYVEGENDRFGEPKDEGSNKRHLSELSHSHMCGLNFSLRPKLLVAGQPTKANGTAV